ncbi:MAG: ATP-dependent DNA ligase, partial [Rhodomicrobium sp.]
MTPKQALLDTESRGAGFLLDPSTPPMEAHQVDSLPEVHGWQFEPKWDGFRCLVFRAGERIE